MIDIIKQISQNRTELMGIAIIAVFFCHIATIAEFPVWWHKDIVSIPINWIFTEGFLFLSGFGVYFSLNKNQGLVSFYKKRIKRVYFPFLIIAGPFLTIFTIYDGDSFWMWIARLTTVNFWIEGNYASMWYVSVIMLMYLLSPIFYQLMRGRKGYFMWILLFSLTLFVIDYVKGILSKDFIHYQWITQVPAFLIGMFVAKSKEIEQYSMSLFILIVILFAPFVKILTIAYYRFMFLPSILYRLSFLVLFAFIISYIKAIKQEGGIIKLMKFLGMHSLELYMLHMLIYELLKKQMSISSTANIFSSIVLSLFLCAPIKTLTTKIISFGSSKV